MNDAKGACIRPALLSRHSLVNNVQPVHLQPHAAATAEALRAAVPKLAAATAATLNSDFGKPQRHLEVSRPSAL
jgi:hypothetical protein